MMSGTAGDDDVDWDWMFDYVMNVFRAPTWEAPIGTFIDENCTVFSDEEENKLAHKEIHEKFCVIAEKLLEQHLEEVGITPEQFVKACEWGRNRRDVNREVFDQLMAIDDFLTFKKMMVKRNMQLELEVIRALKNAGHVTIPRTEEEEEQQLQAALRLSAEESAEDERRRELQKQVSDLSERAAALREEGKSAGPKPTAPVGVDEEDEEELEAQRLEAALQSSLMELTEMKASIRSELAELEQAIAQSLALQSTRLREAEELLEQAEGHSAGGTSRVAPERGKGKTTDRDDREMTAKPSAKASAKATAPPRPAAPVPSSGTASSLAAPKPVMSSLPPVFDPRRQQPLPALAREAEASRAAATATFAANRDLLSRPVAEGGGGSGGSGGDGARDSGAALEDGAADMDKAEMERRAAYLRRQRDRLLAIKRRQREEALAKFKADGGAGGAESEVAEAVGGARSPALAATVGGSRAALASESKASGAGSAGGDATDEDEARMQMRMALCRRLKSDILHDEHERVSRRQAEQYVTLDDKLRRAEELRQLNQQKEMEMQQRLRDLAQERMRNARYSTLGL